MESTMLPVSTLLCHRDVPLGLRCLRSVADASDRPVVFQIHDDGSLTAEDRDLLTDPDTSGIRAGIVPREQVDPVIAELLARFPHCAALRKRQAYGLKLFDIPHFSPQPIVRYVDSDVLFLRATQGLFDLNSEQDCVFMQDHQNAYAMRPWHLLDRRLSLPQRVNSGLFALRRSMMDLERMEWLLAKDLPVFRKLPWFEQTCWAWLAHEQRGFVWDDAHIGVVQAGTVFDDKVVAAHFVSPTRGRIHELPEFIDLRRLPSVQVVKQPMRRLNPAAYMAEMAARSIRRRLA